MQCHGEKILSGPSFVSKAFTETILQEHCCSRRGGGPRKSTSHSVPFQVKEVVMNTSKQRLKVNTVNSIRTSKSMPPDACFRYLGSDNGQKKSTFETQGTGGKGFPHRMVTKPGS